MKKGKFIVFEGGDGVGKTTQIELLANYIRKKDKYQDVLLTREPTWRAEKLRSKLIEDEDPFSDPELTAELFVKDRYEHYYNQILPALEQQAFVLCDRFSFSTIAYQSVQGVPIEKLLKMHEEAEIGRPDLTFYIALPSRVAEQRMRQRGVEREKFERNLDFTRKLARQYSHLFNLSGETHYDGSRLRNLIGNVKKIDGDRKVDLIQEEIKDLVGHYFFKE